MKDVVFIIVDSLCYDYIGRKFSSKSTTPFLDSIKGDCIFAENLFSQGPYTEAGTKGLLCGTDVLDDKGYMFRFDKSEMFITDIFKQNGFETYGSLYPTCVFSNKTLKNIDHMFYTSGFMFDVLWNQKLLYYVELFEKGVLTKSEYTDIEELLQLIFDAWIDFMSVDKEPEKYELIQDLLKDYPWKEYLSILLEEENEFHKDSRKYIDNLFTQKSSHRLNKIKNVEFGNMIKNAAISEAFHDNNSFVKKYKRLQYKFNLKNNHIPAGTFKKTINRLRRKEINKYTFGEYLYKWQLLHRGKDIDTMCHGNNFKYLVSAHTQMDKIIGIMNDKTEKPKFVIAHIEEPHYFTTYLTYDSNDISLLNKEIKYAEEYLDSLTPDYKGLISYQLAIRYIDNELKRLFESLKSNNKIENTIIAIVADHGSSYNCNPLRPRMVNNFHTENYHIPLFIFDRIYADSIKEFCSSKDVIPTILDCLGIPKPRCVTGNSILGDYHCDYVTIEYVGPGCPDMKRRPIWLAIRNENYLISYIGKLSEGFSEDCITEIFDLQNDRDELSGDRSIRNDEVKYLIGKLNERFKKIYDNNKDWITG